MWRFLVESVILKAYVLRCLLPCEIYWENKMLLFFKCPTSIQSLQKFILLYKTYNFEFLLHLISLPILSLLNMDKMHWYMEDSCNLNDMIVDVGASLFEHLCQFPLQFGYIILYACMGCLYIWLLVTFLFIEILIIDETSIHDASV